jgi:RND superfamily putative drug exporter
VIVAWLVLTVAGAVVTAGVSSRLSTSFTLPGEPGYEANEAILRAVGSGGSQEPALIVVSVPSGQEVTSPGVVSALRGGNAALTSALTVRTRASLPRVVSYATSADRALIGQNRLMKGIR